MNEDNSKNLYKSILGFIRFSGNNFWGQYWRQELLNLKVILVFTRFKISLFYQKLFYSKLNINLFNKLNLEGTNNFYK